MCQISSHSENPCTKYLLPNFANFVDRMTDKQESTPVSACDEKVVKQ